MSKEIEVQGRTALSSETHRWETPLPTLLTRKENDLPERDDYNDVVLPPIRNLSRNNDGRMESTKRKRMPNKSGITMVKSTAKNMVDSKESERDTDSMFNESEDSKIESMFEDLSDYKDESLDSDIERYDSAAKKKVTEKRLPHQRKKKDC